MSESTVQRRATLTGLCAVLLWSTMTAFVRNVAEMLGAVGGAAMIYTCASVLLLCTVGFSKVSSFPKKYLFFGGILFATYEVFYSLALGYAHNGRQAIEVSIVNYLWPALTILFASLFNNQRYNHFITAGLILSVFGVSLVLGGEHGFNLREIASNIKSNSLSYGLAFFGAIIWAGYCTVTTKLANGKNGVTLFFMLVAVSLWVKYFMGNEPAFHLNGRSIIYLLLSASTLGFGYAAWNVGILKGNVTILASASYFTPILSSIFAAIVLSAPLTSSFWYGAVAVCLGSLLCWFSTKTGYSPLLRRRG